jgi:DNA polymerase-3 subunit alpha
MVYQEQVMRILNRMGGIDLSSAYRCIKAISKKKHSVIAKFREEFVEGARRQNLDERRAVELFEMIEKFAGYGFNKSHSTAYAAIAFETAYLKAHYPHEFMAALLSCGMESSDRIWEHVDDCRRMGIQVQPPDVNRSEVEFGVDGERLTFGLAAIKGVGEQAVRAVVAQREANGPYESIFDLAERVDPRQLTRNLLEILVKAGALDRLGPNRAQHMAAVERATQSAAARHRDKARGQKSLFGDAEADGGEPLPVESLPDLPDWPHRMKLTCEKETLGFYLTSHPLNEFAEQLEAYASHETSDVANLEDRVEVLIGGMISAIKRAMTKKPTRNGNTRYVNFDLEDTNGSVRCIMWPDDYARLGDGVRPDTVCFIKGRVDRRNREPNVIVDGLYTIEQAEKEFTSQIAIKFQRGVHTEAHMLRVKEILSRTPGRSEVVLVVDSVDESNPRTRLRYLLKTPNELRVSCTPELRAQLAEIVGAEHLQFRSPERKRNGKQQEPAVPAGWA